MAGSLCERPAPRTPEVLYVRERQSNMLHSGPAKIVRTALHEMDSLVERVAQARSKKEFEDSRAAVLEDYVHLSYIIANSFAMRDDRSVRQAAVNQAIKWLGQYFLNEGRSLFGEEPIREAMFCLDTLRRAYRVAAEIHTYTCLQDGADQEADNKLAAQFNFSAVWSQLHVDCLRFLVSRKSAQDPEILHEILQGARHSVMAYSYARQGLELRVSQPPTAVQHLELDSEDKELLNESFSDFEDGESDNSNA